MNTRAIVPIAPKKNEVVYLENSQIKWPNFSGLEGKFNAAGNRNFCVMLEPNVAEQMKKDGWNVKTLTPKDDESPLEYYIQVSVSFKVKPPKVHLVTSRNKTLLTEDLVAIVDFADIDYADLVLSAYHWNVNGNTGVKAYLKNAYIMLHEDRFDQKYIDVPDSAQGSLGQIEAGNVDFEDLGEYTDQLELER